MRIRAAKCDSFCSIMKKNKDEILFLKIVLFEKPHIEAYRLF